MKFNMSEEWLLKHAELEEGLDVSAGVFPGWEVLFEIAEDREALLEDLIKELYLPGDDLDDLYYDLIQEDSLGG